jgi:hypothetical protein
MNRWEGLDLRGGSRGAHSAGDALGLGLSREPDLAFAFHPEIEVQCDGPFVPRPDLRGAYAADWDELVADLHHADTLSPRSRRHTHLAALASGRRGSTRGLGCRQRWRTARSGFSDRVLANLIARHRRLFHRRWSFWYGQRLSRSRRLRRQSHATCPTAKRVPLFRRRPRCAHARSGRSC